MGRFSSLRRIAYRRRVVPSVPAWELQGALTPRNSGQREQGARRPEEIATGPHLVQPRGCGPEELEEAACSCSNRKGAHWDEEAWDGAHAET